MEHIKAFFKKYLTPSRKKCVFIFYWCFVYLKILIIKYLSYLLEVRRKILQKLSARPNKLYRCITQFLRKNTRRVLRLGLECSLANCFQ